MRILMLKMFRESTHVLSANYPKFENLPNKTEETYSFYYFRFFANLSREAKEKLKVVAKVLEISGSLKSEQFFRKQRYKQTNKQTNKKSK